MTNARLAAHIATRSRQRGLSLIELMVGLLIGLIISLAITASISTIGKQFRITGAAINAGESAQLGLDILDRDLRMAGAALYSDSVASMCPSINKYYNGATVYDNAPFSRAFPAVNITDGGATGSDTLDILLSPPSPGMRNAVAVVKQMPTSSSVFKVTDPRDLLQVNDLVLVAHPLPNTANQPCTLIQITNITGSCSNGSNGCNVNYNAGQSDYNPPNPNHVYSDAQTYGPGSVLIKANDYAYRRYYMQDSTLIRQDPNPEPPSALAGNIVMFKAQYGIANAGSDAIVTWESAATATADELTRVKAVRVALVARSPEPDTTVVTGAAPVVFDGALTLDLSAISVPSGKTWQNYRYRIHETVTPLRNVVWNR